MLFKNIFIIIILGITLLLSSCGQSIAPLNEKSTQEVSKQSELSINLFAGQHILVGKIDITTQDDNLSVKYTINNNEWCITEVHTYISTEKPKKATPGKFPYKQENLDCLSEYSEVVSFSDLNVNVEDGDSVYIAAHAVVNGVSGNETETAWAEGTTKFKTGWGSYFTYTIEGSTTSIWL